MSHQVAIAQRMQQIKPSPTLAVNAKAKALKAAGADVLNFSVGEPDFDTPDHVRQAAKVAIDQGFTRYTAVPGIPELREAICQRLRSDHGWRYEPDQIQVCCGGKHGLYNMAQALFGPGDEVIVPTPYWVSYPPIVELAGATPVYLQLREESGFDIEAQALAQCVSPRTRGIIVNSPSNPTGAIFSESGLRLVAEYARKQGWVVISDDIYDTIVYQEGVLPHILRVAPDLQDQTIVLNGVSKSFAMTGWRIGYCAGPKPVIAAMNKIQSQSTSNPCSISQKAALAAVSGPQDFPVMMKESFAKRLEVILAHLRDLPGVSCVRPQGAFYVFPNVSAYFGKRLGDKTIAGSVDLADYLLDEALIASVPGAAFGADDFIRFSFATSLEIINQGMGRLKTALAKLA